MICLAVFFIFFIFSYHFCFSVSQITSPLSYYKGCYQFDSYFHSKTYSKQVHSLKFSLNFKDGHACIDFCTNDAPGERNYNFAGIASNNICFCLEQIPDLRVDAHYCNNYKKCGAQKQCKERYLQLFGICPTGKYGPPLCSGLCPDYCNSAQDSEQEKIKAPACNPGDGSCLYGCKRNVCKYTSIKEISLQFSPSNYSRETAPHSSHSLKPGVSIFPDMWFKYDGILSGIRGKINNDGISYASFWRYVTDDVWEMVNKIEFLQIGMDKVQPFMERNLTANSVFVSKGDVVGLHHKHDTVVSVKQSLHHLYTLWSATYLHGDLGSTYLSSEYYDDGWTPGLSVKVRHPENSISVLLEVKYKPFCRSKCAQQCSDPDFCEHGCLLGFMGKTCNETCPAKTFGMDCEFQCSETCKNQVSV